MKTEWSELGYWTSGLDPLGLQAFPIELYQQLIPGLTNITVRPRFYSFYTWLCWINARNENLRITDDQEWRTFVRRSEAILTLASLRSGIDDAYGMPGVEWARKQEDTDQIVDVTVATDPEHYGNESKRYLKAPQGGFGQAYKPVLLNTLGLLAQADEHSIAVPSQDTGDKLAEAFADNVGEAAKVFLGCVETGKVSDNELQQIGQSFHPLSFSTDSNEWKQLSEVVLGGLGGEPHAATSRMNSLRLFLETSRQSKSSSGWEFRWTAYSGYTSEGNAFNCPGQLRDQADKWQAYHTSDLFQLTIGALFQLTVDRIPNEGADESGLLDSMCRDLTHELSGGDKAMTWAQFRASQKPTQNAYDETNAASDFSLADQVYEAVSDYLMPKAFEGAIAALRLLAVLDQRMSLSEWPAAKILHELSSQRKSPKDIVAFLHKHESEPIADALNHLVREFVIKGHLTEAYRKLVGQNRFTFYFHIDNGRLIRSADGVALNYTTPRLDTTTNFLYDLRLIDDDGITPLGEEILEGAK